MRRLPFSINSFTLPVTNWIINTLHKELKNNQTCLNSPGASRWPDKGHRTMKIKTGRNNEMTQAYSFSTFYSLYRNMLCNNLWFAFVTINEAFESPWERQLHGQHYGRSMCALFTSTWVFKVSTFYIVFMYFLNYIKTVVEVSQDDRHCWVFNLIFSWTPPEKWWFFEIKLLFWKKINLKSLVPQIRTI